MITKSRRLADFAHERELCLRFIEFMPLDSGRAWLKELVVPGREILQRLQGRHSLRPVLSSNPSETSRRWTFPDGRGEIGIIAPVTEPFCGHCNRLRLTADGKIRTCLFSLGRARLEAPASGRRYGRGDLRPTPRDCLEEGAAPSYRRARFCSARSQHELHRWMISVLSGSPVRKRAWTRFRNVSEPGEEGDS